MLFAYILNAKKHHIVKAIRYDDSLEPLLYVAFRIVKDDCKSIV